MNKKYGITAFEGSPMPIYKVDRDPLSLSLSLSLSYIEETRQNHLTTHFQGIGLSK